MPDSLTGEMPLRELLSKQIRKALARFPHFFDARLLTGLDKILANSSQDFVATCSAAHLHTLLLAQFFLQKKMEEALKPDALTDRPLFLKVFRSASHICLALAFHDSYRLHREQLLKTMHLLAAGIHEVPRSFFLWHHPEMPYLFCSMQLYKLRGEELSIMELKHFKTALREQLITTAPHTPALFWPYNEEESLRHLQILQKEIQKRNDLPHVFVQFRKQTPSSLEFLIHLVRYRPLESLERCLKQFPSSLQPMCHFTHLRNSVESSAFSLKVPSCTFESGESINLLYARRYCLKHLEALLGPMRDYNGGLLEKQQQHFDSIRQHLGNTIRHFDLFAEKVFYALYPVERRLVLSLAEAEDLFSSFSNLIYPNKSSCVRSLENVSIIRALDVSELPLLSKTSLNSKKFLAYVQLFFGGAHYCCLLCPRGLKIDALLKEDLVAENRTNILHLIFQEGAPLSLNPYHCYGDMRCRLLSKLLFEGLMRLDAEGSPQLAGALHVEISNSALLYTITLRPSYWSNGERVSAADYVMSLQRALSDPVSHPELLFILKGARQFREKKIDSSQLGIHALSANTLQLELERQDPYFLHKLAKPFFFPLFGPMREPKWFNGPFTVRKQTQECILLERNPYSDKRQDFEQISIQWINDSDKIYSLFLKGQTDWIGDPISPLPLPIIAELKRAEKLRMRKTSRQFLLLFNTQHPLLCSSLLRRALSLCLDRVAICNTIFPYCEPIPPLHPDKKEARRLFDLALSELGKEISELTFSYSNHSRRKELAEYLQLTWKESLGITLHLEKSPWNVFRNKLEKGDFQIAATIHEAPDESRPESYAELEGDSSWNFARWNHPLYHKLLKEPPTHATLSEAKKILCEEAPFAPLFSYTHLYAHHPKLQNYLIDNEGCIDFSQSHLNSEH